MELFIKLVALAGAVWFMFNIIKIALMLLPQKSKVTKDIREFISTDRGDFVLSKRDDEDWILQNEFAPCRISLRGEFEPDANLLEFINPILDDYKNIENLAKEHIMHSTINNPLLMLLYVKNKKCYFDLRIEIDDEDIFVQYYYQPDIGTKIIST